MAIITNLDKPSVKGLLSQKQIAETERFERRKEVIDKAYKAAEDSFAIGSQTADVVYSGMQQRGAYSADSVVDTGRQAIVNAKSLPVREYVVTPQGELIKDIPDSALEEVRRGAFCAECEDRQPEVEGIWELAMSRLEAVIGPRPAHARHGSVCCYCGFNLGVHGDLDEGSSSITTVTPDQAKVFETIFGKQFRTED